MPRPAPGKATMKTLRQAQSATSQRKLASTGMSASADKTSCGAISGSCFRSCSPIRSRCPGPAAQLSSGHDGRWTAVCRRAVS